MRSPLETMEIMDFHRIRHKVLLEYVPYPLFQEAQSKISENPTFRVQTVIDNADNMLKMYGTSEELDVQLEIYGNHPLRRKKYQVPLKTILHTIPKKYHNLKGDLFYCKQDYLFHLQASVYEKFSFFDNGAPQNLKDFMEKHEKRLENCFEFVKYDKEIFDKIQGMFVFSKSLMENPSSEKVSPTSNECKVRVLNFSDQDDIASFERCIKEYPHIFLSNKEANSKNGTAAVRIFEDGDEKFLLAVEWLNAANSKSSSPIKVKTKDANGCFFMVKMEKLMEKFKNDIEKHEFIRTPIVRAKHAAVPFLTPSGAFCILASDGLIEVLRFKVIGLKVFQKIKKEHWHLVKKIFKLLEKSFDADFNYIYCIEERILQKLKLDLAEYWKCFESKTVKSVRDVKKTGFTVKDLKEELKFLELTKIFPDITDYAAKIYSEVDKKKKSDVLRTCDMYDAIEKCQFACIFKRFPNLVKFLHQQKACQGKSFVTCEECQMKTGSEALETNQKFEKKQNEQPSNPAVLETKTTNSMASESDLKANATPEAPKTAPELQRESKNKEIPVPVAPKPSKTPEILLPESTEFMELTRANMVLLKKALKEKNLEIERLEGDLRFSDNLEEKIGELAICKIQIEEKLKTEIQKNEKLAKELEVCRIEFQKKLQESKHKSLEVTRQKDVEIQKLLGEMKQCRKRNEDLEKQLKEIKEKVEKTNEQYVKQFEILEKSHSSQQAILKKASDSVGQKNAEILEIQLLNLKVMKGKDEEIDRLNKSQLQLKNDKKKENNRLKQATSKTEKLEAENKKLMARITEEEAKMKRENKELTDKIRNLEESAEKDQLDMAMKLNLLETQNAEKDKVIRELQESSQQQHLETDRANKELQDTILTVRDFLNSKFPPDPPIQQEGTKEPSALRCQLLGLQKIKDIFRNGTQLGYAKEMVQKLISSSNRPEIHQMANYEYEQYEGKIRNYLQEVEKNIQILKKSESGDVTALPSLPDFPSFSDRFIQEYWLKIDKEKASGELQDSECLFCFIEMKSEEKTLKCEHCRKITHLECASKWLKIHRSCPHCRREQLDPNEFPILQ